MSGQNNPISQIGQTPRPRPNRPPRPTPPPGQAMGSQQQKMPQMNPVQAALNTPSNPRGYTSAGFSSLGMSPGETGFAAPTFAQQVTEGYLGNNPNDPNTPPSLTNFADTTGGTGNSGAGAAGGVGGASSSSGEAGGGQAPHMGAYISGPQSRMGNLTPYGDEDRDGRLNIPAMLEQGEYVTNADATSRNLSKLENINKSVKPNSLHEYSKKQATKGSKK